MAQNLPSTRSTLRGWVLALAVAGGLLATTGTSLAQTQVYSEDFDVDSTANWTVNTTAGGDNRADLYFDYSTVGIPPAPHTTGGTTRGLKLQANLTPASQVFPSGVSVSPNGFSITENFEMHWDMWINYNGPLNGGGSGSTQVAGGGYGTAGTSVNVAGSGIDAIIIGATGDGGSGADYRVYSPGKATSYQDGQYVLGGGWFDAGYTDFRPGNPTSGFVYAGNAGSRNNTAGNPTGYYQTNFPGGVTAPAAQLALYPQQTGSTAAGAVGMKWRDVSIRKVANTITYRIDGVLIATIDAVDAVTNTIPPGSIAPLGGANILFNHYDIQATASTDPNAQYLAFSLFDNVRITNFPSIVTVTAPAPDASEAGPTPGTFTIIRTEPGPAVTIYYTMSGDASNGVDYAALPGSITLAVGETSTNITLTPIDDGVSEFAETVILNISEGTNYFGAGNATVTIADNDTPTIDISTVIDSMYERLPTDYVRYRLTRRGDLNSAPFDVNLTYSGTAAASRHSGTTPVSVNSGSLTTDFDVNPIDDSLLQGDQTIICTVAGGTGYAVGTISPSATATILDDELPAETVLFADNFNTDSSADWTLRYASTNSADNDYSATFAYDYSTYPVMSIPPAPHSGADTHGLFLQVNKVEPTEVAAALNLYPKNKTFSGNFALRFDMYLIIPTSATTEYALFGINHSGTQTNWFRNSTGGFAGVSPTGWTFDGLFYGVETDAEALGDYALYSAPTTAGNNPTSLNSRNASTLTSVYKAPPYALAGAPSNLSSSSTPSWADVEISQVGNLVTLKINRTVIFSYTNTTAFTSGNVMLGHCDAYDSVGASDGGVIYDNLRVIRLAASAVAANITGIVPVGAPATSYNINYSGGTGTQFVLVTSHNVNAPLSGWTRVATNYTGSGTFSVSAGTQGFYRIKSE